MLDKEYIIEEHFIDDNGDLYMAKVSTNTEEDRVYYVVDLHDLDSKELLETFMLYKTNNKWLEKEGHETTGAIKYGKFIDENL